jgi:hypothetical protein
VIASHTHTTIEEPLEAVFSVVPSSRLYVENRNTPSRRSWESAERRLSYERDRRLEQQSESVSHLELVRKTESGPISTRS